MNYYFNKNKIIAFTNNLTVEFDSPFKEVDKEFCIDENGYNLLKAINPEEIKVGESLILDKKTKIRLLNDKPANQNREFFTELFIDLNILKQASQFVETKNTNRPALQGVYVNDLGTIVATDSFKLFVYNCGQSKNSVILSKEFVKELCNYSGLQLLRFNANTAQVFIEEENTTITGTLYQGTYPNVFGIIPQAEEVVKLNKDEILNHLNIGKFISGDSKVCRLTNKEISIYNFSSEGDIYKNDLNCSCETEFNYILNYDHLRLAISCFENIVISVNDSKVLKPIVVYDESNEKTKVILIPMREA